MSLWSKLGTAVVLFSLATVLAESGLLAVLWQRNQLNANTVHNLLTVAYDVPLRDMLDDITAKSLATKREMVSFAEVQEARMLAALDVDMRRMAFDKGLTDMRELAVLLNQEKGRYTQLKDRFDEDWANLRKGASNTALRDVQHQIESLQPRAAKDQLLRILDSPELTADVALNQVVGIFKNLSLDQRKKLIAEFKDADAPRLQEILRQIRLGMPEVKLLRDTRTRLQEFRVQE